MYTRGDPNGSERGCLLKIIDIDLRANKYFQKRTQILTEGTGKISLNCT
jgi:hypothetical protein